MSSDDPWHDHSAAEALDMSPARDCFEHPDLVGRKVPVLQHSGSETQYHNAGHGNQRQQSGRGRSTAQSGAEEADGDERPPDDRKSNPAATSNSPVEA
jgi:hypothetical protein